MNDLNNFLIRMSEEEKCEAKEQLKQLHQAYSELSQMSVRSQTPCAEQVRHMNSFPRDKRCSQCMANLLKPQHIQHDPVGKVSNVHSH